MSARYNEYIHEHQNAVKMAFDWLLKNTSGITSEDVWNKASELIDKHDMSKYSEDEYQAYDQYFYGNKSYQATVDFEQAWNLHIHRNPHHWQYWVLIHDDPNKPYTYLPMPSEYIIEMICDWWSFSWRNGNLYEIYSWYEEHKTTMKLNVGTRETVEMILETMKNILMKTYHKDIEEMIGDNHEEN